MDSLPIGGQARTQGILAEQEGARASPLEGVRSTCRRGRSRALSQSTPATRPRLRSAPSDATAQVAPNPLPRRLALVADPTATAKEGGSPQPLCLPTTQ